MPVRQFSGQNFVNLTRHHMYYWEPLIFLRYLMGQTTQPQCLGRSSMKLDPTLSALDRFCSLYSAVITPSPIRVSNCVIVVSILLQYKTKYCVIDVMLNLLLQ